jgi:effector-binding domain-containing protein
MVRYLLETWYSCIWLVAQANQRPYGQLGEVFKKIAEWANENGYEVSGAPMTVYYNEAGSVPDDELVTEVQIPVKRKAGPE